MAVLTWVHLSDWHQGGGDFDRKVVADALLKDIKARAGIERALERIDFVFFTGDLAYNGLKTEFDAARDLLLEPIHAELALPKSRLFLIPGNHDLDRKQFRRLPAEVQAPFQSKKQTDEWLTDPDLRSDLLKPFSAYRQFVAEYEASGFSPYGESRVISLDVGKIGILGCNSALMCGRNKNAVGEVNDDRYLTVGEPQIHDALQTVEQADVRIALIHHPFEWLREDERGLIRRRLQQGCHFILRGHVHEQAVESLVGREGACVTVHGGACYNGRIPHRPQHINAYNYVTYDTETGRGNVYLRRWSLNDTGWTADTDQAREGRCPFALPIASEEAETVSPAKRRQSSSNRLSAKPGKPPGIDPAVVRRTYLEYVSRRWENLEMRGISRTRKAEAIRLDEVYVSLTAERETVQSRRPIVGDVGTERNDDGSTNFVLRLEEDLLVTPSRFGAISERRVERIGLPEALRENRCLVVLGDPGAGKTTLARFLARRFALACGEGSERVLVPVLALPTLEKPTPAVLSTDDYGGARIPLLLRVADFAEALSKDGNLRLRDFLYYARGDAEISDAAATALFEEALIQGQVLVILDGLDEVAHTADRGKIARRIDDFVAGIDARNRIVVTSRVVGYPAARLDGHFFPVTMQAAERLRAVRDNPRFREVIRLAVASRSEEDAAHLIRSAIWCPSEESPKYGYTPSPYEDILLTDLLLCVECLGDCATIEPLLARAVAGKLVALCLLADALYSITPRRERIDTMLSLLRHRDIATEAIPVLIYALQDKYTSVRNAAASALGNAAVGSADVVPALIKALQGEDRNVQNAAWKSLCTLLRG